MAPWWCPIKGIWRINPLYPNNIPLETPRRPAFRTTRWSASPRHNFYPRFGAAYKLTSDGQIAIRAGYGIYGNSIYGAIGQSMAGRTFRRQRDPDQCHHQRDSGPDAGESVPLDGAPESPPRCRM